MHESRDRLTPRQRSTLMARIRAKDTTPELRLRKELWRRGYRYRLHRRILGARPDLVFEKARVVIFVDGCFWHGCPIHYIPPVSNSGYWRTKITGNRQRDSNNNRALIKAGYTVLRFWECEIRSDLTKLVERVEDALRTRP